MDDQIPTLDPELLYEECPRCQGRAQLCLTCMDEGIIVHACPEEGGDGS